MDISQYIDNEMTLTEMSKKIIECANNENNARHYLGMSEIGEPCWRLLWYRFRQVDNKILSLSSILNIADGHNQESIMADRLRLVDGIKLDTVDPKTKDQFEYKLLGGHFCGHADGLILGILESPKTPHVWENKAVNSKKFKELKNLISDIGEKQALEKWDMIYYAQAQIYMHFAKFKRHFLTVETPGGREYTSCRTEYNANQSRALISKAEMIVKSDRPPEKLNTNRSFYLCNWCAMRDVCHDTKVPKVCCRTCAFSEPILKSEKNNGLWHCHKKKIDFTKSGSVCDSHIFLNTLVPFKVVGVDESSETPSWIKYQIPETKETFFNVSKNAKTLKGAQNLTSFEMCEKEYFELCFDSESVKNEILKNNIDDKKTNKKLKGII